MKKIALPFVAFGLLAAPAFMAAPSIGGPAQAEEIRIGVPTIRVEDRDRDRDRDRWRWRRDYDRDDMIVIKKRHHRDRDDD